MDFISILSYEFFGNTIQEYLISLGVFVFSLIGLKIFKAIILKKLKDLTNQTKTDIDNLLFRAIDFVGWMFYVVFSLFLAVRFVVLPPWLERAIDYALIIVAVYYIVKSLQVFIDFGVQRTAEKMQDKEESASFDPSVIKLLSKIAKIVLWIVALAVVLQNLGFNVSTLVAGMGLGGLAVAFAIQNILGDIFASFSIYFDKPFQIGDFIIVGDDMGTVVKIGIKSTRMTSLTGEELVISNKELTESRIHNYKKMKERRIVFGFGVLYETPNEKLRKIPEIVGNIMSKMDLARLDRVNFKDFGDSSLNYEVVYYLNSADYNDYMNIQEEMNLKIKEAFEKEGIGMAYPTQTVYLKKE
jgi:small-conductance mechanosensitive channel